MTETLSRKDENVATASARSIMSPYLVMRDFLDTNTAARLLDFALAHTPVAR